MASEATARGKAVRVLMAGGLMSFFSGPAVLVWPFGIFAIAIAESAGLPKQAVAATIGPVLLLSLLLAPVIGWVIQRFPTPALVVVAMVGAAAGLLILSMAPTAPILFGITLAVAFLLTVLASPGVTSALVFQTFDKGRGLALGAVSAFTGLGVAVIPVADSWMIGQWGWRSAYAVGGGVIFLAAIVNLLVLRGVSSRVPITAQPEGQSMGAVLKESLAYLRKDPTFWTIGGLFFLLAILANTMPLHLPLILQERGADPTLQALSLTVTGVTMIVARPLMGWVLDWLPIRWVLASMVAGPFAGVLSLLTGASTLGALISAAGFGLTIGGEIVCLSYIISRAFPLERFGSTYGWSMLVMALGGGVGPIAVSALVKISGGYDAALMMMVAVSVLALSICFFFVNNTRFRFSAPDPVQQGV